MISILFIGDPHVKTDNIPETDLLIKNILKYISEKKPDICIIGGDVMHYHEKLYTIALNKSHEMIKKISEIVKTFVLVGNHDYINNQQFLTENHWMNSMKDWPEDLSIVDQPIHFKLNGIDLMMCPYVYPGRFVEALDKNKDFNWKESDVIFAHQEFKGCKMGAITSEMGDSWELEYPKVVSGHIHNNQKPQDNIYYPGASMQQAFGESEDCILALITIKKDNGKSEIDIQELELDMPKKKIVRLDISKIDDFKMKETDDKIRLTLTGDYDEFKSFKKTEKFKKLTDKGVKVVFKHKKIKKEENDNPDIKDTKRDITDFNGILEDIVNKSRNVNLIRAYEYIVNNKKLEEGDILFL